MYFLKYKCYIYYMKRSRNIKTMNCKHCDEKVENVGDDVVSVICWRCVSASMRGSIQIESEESEESEESDSNE